MPLQPSRVAPLASGTIDILDFSGGLNLKSTLYQVAKNQSTILQNYYIVQDGSLLGRGGTKLFNSSSLGSAPIQGAYRAQVGTNSWLAFYSGTVYQGNDSNGTFASSLSGLNATALATFIQYLTFVYFATQQDAMQKFDGTNWTAAGLAAPVGAPTVAQATGGSLDVSHTYQVYYTFVTPTFESNPSPVGTVVLDASHNAISVSGLPALPANVTQLNIYGFEEGVSSVSQLIGNTTGSTFSITTAQSTWGASIPTQNTPPPTGIWVGTQWKNRLWWTGKESQRIYFSEVFEPEVYPATYFIDIPFEGSDTASALLALGDLLIVWGYQQLFYIFGATPFTFIVEQSFAQNGALSPWAVVRISNAAVYLGQFGIFSFDGAQETRLADPIEPQFTGVGTSLTPISVSNAKKYATIQYYNKLKALVVSFPTTGPHNDVTYWHFLDRHAWTQDTRAVRLLLVKEDGTLWAWDSGAGVIRQWDIGSDDDGAAIVKVYQSGAFSGPSVDSTQRYTWLTMRGEPNGSTPQVTAYIDSGAVTDSMVLTMGSQGSQIGSAIIGTSVISPSVVQMQERWNSDCIGNTFQINVTISDKTQPKLLGLSQRYDVISKPRYLGANA